MDSSSEATQQPNTNDAWQVAVSLRTAKSQQKQTRDNNMAEQQAHQYAAALAASLPRQCDLQDKRVPEKYQHKSAQPPTAPTQRTPLIQAARHIVSLYNVQSLVQFLNPLSVEPITTQENIWNPTAEDQTTVKLRRNFPLTIIQLQMFRGFNSQGRSLVMVQEADGSARTFQAYLSSLEPPASLARTGEEGLNQQRRWWSNNGKSFEHLKLPGEMRTAVYAQVFPDTLHLTQRSRGRWRFGTGSENQFSDAENRRFDSTHKTVPPPKLDLLHVNRQIKRETEHFLWFYTTKGFATTAALQHYYIHTFSTSNPAIFNNLRFLELDMSHRHYINMFRVDLPPFSHSRYFQNDVTARLLRSLRSVKHFTMRFESPFEAKRNDPWGDTGHLRGWRKGTDWNGNTLSKGFDTSCQKTLVDWILTFAKEHIQHFPEITLGGAIKHSTKAKFDRIFADEKDGIHHDMERAKFAISATPAYMLPPICNCTTPCEYEPYYYITHELAHEEFYCRGHDSGRCRLHPDSVVGRAKAEKKRQGILKNYKFDFRD